MGSINISPKAVAHQILRRASQSGYRIRVKASDSTKICIHASREDPGLLEEIKGNRDAILDILLSAGREGRLTPTGELPPVPTADEYDARLKKGMDWLVVAWAALNKEGGEKNTELSKAFERNLHAWRDVEEEKLKLYKHVTCPMGGCDSASQPVQCDVCTNNKTNGV